MCIAAPGKILKIEGKKATVLYGKETRLAMIADVTPEIGDYVLVQMGVVMQKLEKEEAKEAMKGWGILAE